MTLPDVAVDGVGAVEFPVPPVEVVYHNNPLPVAERGLAIASWQYTTGVVTTGVAVAATIVTTMDARGPSQLFTVWLT